jgi:hypothetical protein
MPVVDGKKYGYTPGGRRAAAKARRQTAAGTGAKQPGDPTRRPEHEKITARRCPPAQRQGPSAATRRIPVPPVPGMAGGGRLPPPGAPSPQGAPLVQPSGAPSSAVMRPPGPVMPGGIPGGAPAGPQGPVSPAIQQLLNQLRLRQPQ